MLMMIKWRTLMSIWERCLYLRMEQRTMVPTPGDKTKFPQPHSPLHAIKLSKESMVFVQYVDTCQ